MYANIMKISRWYLGNFPSPICRPSTKSMPLNWGLSGPLYMHVWWKQLYIAYIGQVNQKAMLCMLLLMRSGSMPLKENLHNYMLWEWIWGNFKRIYIGLHYILFVHLFIIIFKPTNLEIWPVATIQSTRKYNKVVRQ